MKRKSLWWVFAFIVAVAAGGLVAWAASSANDIYYRGHPFRGDTFSYFMKQMQLYLLVQEHGAATTVWNDFLVNVRDPLRTVPYLLISARELTSLNGHLFFSTFSYTAFAVTGIYCLHQRTGSWTYGITIAILPILADGFLAPIHGFPSKLPDFPAALLGGAALFSLITSERGRSLSWLMTFSVFAALAALSRIISAGYVLVICGPILALYLYEMWRNDVRRMGPIILRILMIGTIISLLAGHFLWTRLPQTFTFYGTEGYALFHGPLSSFNSTLMRFILSHLGGIGIVAALILGMFYVGTFWNYRRSIRSLFDAVWPVASYSFLVVFVIGLEDDFTQMFYVIPGLALLATAPFALLPRGQELLGKSRTWSIALPLVMVVLAISHTLIVLNGSPLRIPNAAGWLQLKFQRSLSGAMIKVIRKTDYDKRPPAIEIAFAAYGRFISGDLMIRRRLFVKWEEIFELRRPVWESHLRGTRDQKISTVHDRILCRIDALAMFEHPKKKQTLVTLKDTYSQDMADRLLKIVRDRPFAWRQESHVQSPWGNVLVYLNLTRRKHAMLRKDVTKAIAARAAARARLVGAVIPVTVETFFGDGGKAIAAYTTAQLKRPATAPGLLQSSLAALRAPSKTPIADRVAALHNKLTSKTAILVLPHETLCPGPSTGRLNKRQTDALWALQNRVSRDSVHWRAGLVLATSYGLAKIWRNKSRP